MSDNNSNNTGESSTKEVMIHGWAEIGPSATLTVTDERSVSEISKKEQITELKEQVKSLGYNPDKFHITVDYTEEKYNQDTPNGETEYVVYGWCEYAPTTVITIPETTATSSVTTTKAINALKKEVQRNGIDPKDVTIEVDEILEK